jgi:hypothetical protein
MPVLSRQSQCVTVIRHGRRVSCVVPYGLTAVSDAPGAVWEDGDGDRLAAVGSGVGVAAADVATDAAVAVITAGGAGLPGPQHLSVEGAHYDTRCFGMVTASLVFQREWYAI